MLGFPIRTSSDHSSVDSSPRLIAASYVLHRLLVPRHPPCALKNLATKMLASTVQFSNNNPKPAHTTTPPPDTVRRRYDSKAGPEKETNNKKRTSRSPLCPSSQDPTAYLQPTHPPQPVPTHPNKGMDHNPEEHRTSRRTRHRRTTIDRTSQRSTHEHHRRTYADEMGLNPQ